MMLSIALALAANGADIDARVAAVATAAVHARLAERGRDMAVVIAPARRAWPADARVLDASVAGPLPRARVPVTVHVDAGGRVRAATLWAELSDIRSVPTYSATYRHGTPGSAVLTSAHVVDLARYDAPLAESLPADAVLARDVAAGEPVLAGDFVAVRAVRPGDRVELEARSGGVELHSGARALESGDPGDRIRVRVDASSRAVVARIVETGRVTLDD